jgi:hypothetical protein
MSNHQVFIVHGMGNFENDIWAGNLKAQFRDLFGQYTKLRENNYVNGFDLHALNYSEVFEDYRQQWRNDAKKAADALLKSDWSERKLDRKAADQLVKLANGATGDDFWRTHVLDVVMYRYLPQITQTIRRSIEVQIKERLKSFGDDIPDYSIICHSLGTAVIYESFYAMINDSPPLYQYFRPVNVFMVANVVKPLWNYGGTCYPTEMGPDSTNKGFCNYFANFSHKLDPFSNFDRFDKPEAKWFSPTAQQDERYLNVDLPAEDIQITNVHALEHYLSHPDVHVPILRCLTGSYNNIPDTEHKKALVEWRAKSVKNKASGIATDTLKNYLIKSATNGFKDELSSLLGFRKTVLALGRQDGES